MHVAATNQAVSHESDTVIAEPRAMTPAELRQLGVPSLVYLRAGMRNGEVRFAIHAADGTPMAEVEDIELAIELVSEHGMEFVAVH